MSVRTFLDTNVLIYAFDDAAPAKRDRARTLLATPRAPLVISAQVIGEFYVVVTRKLAKPLAADHARAAVEQLLRLPVIPVDAQLTQAAVTTCQSAQLSYWDALIIEAASAAGCDLLLTEDLANGSTIRSVLIENPFA